MDTIVGAAWSAVAALIGVAIASWVIPSVRWARSLKRDLDIYNGLPDGHEKATWIIGIEERASRLRRYPQEVPLLHRVIQVTFVIVVASSLVALATTFWRVFIAWAVDTALSGDHLNPGGWWTRVEDWSSIIVLVALVIVGSPVAIDGLRGRPNLSFFFDPLMALLEGHGRTVAWPKRGEMTDPAEVEAWLKSTLQGLGYRVEKIPAEDGDGLV